MESTWFVVGDQSRVNVYRVSGPRMRPILEAVDELEDPLARTRSDPSESGINLSFVDVDSTRSEQQRRFARRVVHRLRKGHQSGDFRRLYIAAPAGFVGRLRSLYGSSLAHSVRREIIGDYTHVKMRDLNRRVKDWLE